MYDDRLEIESPGRLPDVVTVDNIAYTRFSRNKTISRVMTEFRWVRELNEGVKKIYSDMADAGLPEPEYVETANTVKLILRNNIDARQNKTSDANKALNDVLAGYEDIWDQLDEVDRQIVSYVVEQGSVSRAVIEEYTGKSTRTVSRRLSRLMEINAIVAVGNAHDPNRRYEGVKK